MNISWNNIIAHQKIIQQLKDMEQEKRIFHAMLFCGREGIGKSLVAEAMASLLLCSSPKEGEACGVCSSCLALAGERHPDFFPVLPEFTGKGNGIIKIEAIRNLQESMSRVPLLAARQVAIIYDADKMNEAAFNCLLKTLEEPGGAKIFILVTSRPFALQDTILSRCMRFEFAPLLLEEMKAILSRLNVDRERLSALASWGDGSIARALELTDELCIELQQDALRTLRDISHMSLEDILEKGRYISALEREKASLWLDFFSMLCRDMLCLFSGSQGALYNAENIGELRELISQYSPGKLFALLKLLAKYQQRLQSNASLQLMVEGFLIRFKDLCGGVKCRQ